MEMSKTVRIEDFRPGKDMGVVVLTTNDLSSKNIDYVNRCALEKARECFPAGTRYRVEAYVPPDGGGYAVVGVVYRVKSKMPVSGRHALLSEGVV